MESMLVSIDEEALEGVTGGGEGQGGSCSSGLTFTPGGGFLGLGFGANVCTSAAGSVNILGLLGIDFGFSFNGSAAGSAHVGH